MVWDATTGEQLHVLRCHEDFSNAVAVSPDGHQIVSGGDDGAVMVWDAETGEQVHGLDCDTNEIFAVAFTPDGRRIVTGGADKAVRVWDAETGVPLRDLSKHVSLETVAAVAVSADGRRIVASGNDGTTTVWDTEAGERLHVFDCPQHWGVVAITPDGRQIMTGGTTVRGVGDSMVRVWDADTAVVLHTLDAHRGGVTGIVVIPASGTAHEFVTVGMDGKILIWDLNTGALLRGTGVPSLSLR
jgi:WD40 repeat protein